MVPGPVGHGPAKPAAAPVLGQAPGKVKVIFYLLQYF